MSKSRKRVTTKRSPQTLHNHYDVWICDTNWSCPDHTDSLSCYLEQCTKFKGNIQGDWRLLEVSADAHPKMPRITVRLSPVKQKSIGLCRCESSPPGLVASDRIHCGGCGGHFPFIPCADHNWKAKKQ